MSTTKLTVSMREKIIAAAWAKRGVHESPPNSNRVEFSAWWGYVGAWCAMFCSWSYYHLLGWSPFPASSKKGFAYCPNGVDWFRSRGKFASKRITPKRGWLIFFDFIGRPSHVGIVLDVLPDGRIHTLEGNTNAAGSRDGGSVMDHYRSLGTVVGYGVIDFEPEQAPVKPGWHAPAWPKVTLQLGSTGENVAILKMGMIAAGYKGYISTKGNDAYEFGPGTVAGVKKIQQDHNTLMRIGGHPGSQWKITGKVGEDTWNYIWWAAAHKK